MTNDEIRTLFDVAIEHQRTKRGDRFRDRAIFFEVLGDSRETRERFATFLHDVSTCPPEVIAWCQQELHTLVSKRRS